MTLKISSKINSIVLLLVLFLLPLTAFSNDLTIKYVDDILYVNDTKIASTIKKGKLDKIIKSKSRKLKAKERNEKTGRKEKITYLIYDDLGLIFRQNKSMPSVIHLSVHMYQASQSKIAPPTTGTFKGKFYIGDNLINDKRSMDALSSLKEVELKVLKVKVMEHTAIAGADLIYKKHQIQCYFDDNTKEMIYVTILHGIRLK